jgi:importin subunit alpha-1
MSSNVIQLGVIQSALPPPKGTKEQIQTVLDAGIAAPLVYLLQVGWGGRRGPQTDEKSGCLTIALFLNPPSMPPPQNAEFDIKKEAAWAISNATSGGSQEQIDGLVQVGARDLGWGGA